MHSDSLFLALAYEITICLFTYIRSLRNHSQLLLHQRKSSKTHVLVSQFQIIACIFTDMIHFYYFNHLLKALHSYFLNDDDKPLKRHSRYANLCISALLLLTNPISKTSLHTRYSYYLPSPGEITEAQRG